MTRASHEGGDDHEEARSGDYVDTFEACSVSQPDGARVYARYRQCIEQLACADSCRPAHRAYFECRYRLDGSGPCDECILESCCAEASACRRDAECSPCLSKVDADEASCVANDLYRVVRQCFDRDCAACAPFTELLPEVPAPEVDAGVDPTPGAGDPTPDAGRDASLEPDAGAPSGSDDGGCGCRSVAVRSADHAALGAALVTLMCGLVGRRRVQQRSPARRRGPA